MGVRDGLETRLAEVGPLGGYHSLEGGPVAMGLEEAEMTSAPILSLVCSSKNHTGLDVRSRTIFC